LTSSKQFAALLVWLEFAIALSALSVSVFSISALPKSPFSPPSNLRQGYDRQAGLATGSLNGLNPKSKFLQLIKRPEI
jgi:hypothetical protein